MNHRIFLFVGGSREGIWEIRSPNNMLTFVDGLLARVEQDGSIKMPLNATVETYLLEKCAHGSPLEEHSFAYFLLGLEAREAKTRLALLREKISQLHV